MGVDFVELGMNCPGYCLCQRYGRYDEADSDLTLACTLRPRNYCIVLGGSGKAKKEKCSSA